MGPLLEIGVEGFCWVAPYDDQISDARFRQVNVHGAFVYFFHESEDTRDCFFLIDDDPKQTCIPDELQWSPFTIANKSPLAPEEELEKALGACGAECWNSLRQLWLSDRATKAEGRCLLERPLAKEWVVKVLGHVDIRNPMNLLLADYDKPRWYRRRRETSTDEKGAVWVKQEEAVKDRAQHHVRLTLMPAIPFPGRRLKTFSRGKEVFRASSMWTVLGSADLGDHNEELFQLQDSFAQHRYGWYLVPMDEALDDDAALETPTASRGKLYRLVLPYSAHAKVLLFGNGFHGLGIGIELYFAQLVSLALAFILMGFASFGSMLTNISQVRSAIVRKGGAGGE